MKLDYQIALDLTRVMNYHTLVSCAVKKQDYDFCLELLEEEYTVHQRVLGSLPSSPSTPFFVGLQRLIPDKLSDIRYAIQSVEGMKQHETIS